MMAKRPFTTIKAGSDKVRCVWMTGDERDDAEADGYYSSYKGLLGIWEEQRPEVGADTIVHEVLHIATEMVGIDDANMPKTEEELVSRLGKALSALIASNPVTAGWIPSAFHSKEPTIRKAWETRKKRR